MAGYLDIANAIRGYVRDQVAARRVLFSAVVSSVNPDGSVNLHLDNGQAAIGVLSPRPLSVGEIISVVADGPAVAIL